MGSFPVCIKCGKPNVNSDVPQCLSCYDESGSELTDTQMKILLAVMALVAIVALVSVFGGIR